MEEDKQVQSVPATLKEGFEATLEASIQQTQQMNSLQGIAELKNASVKEIVDGIIRYAYLSRASDIHLDPMEDRVVFRFRIDGILHDVISFPHEMHSKVITRIKILSGLRTDEHFAAQDGRFRLSAPDMTVDMRVSIVPAFHGENAVMRLLVAQTRVLRLEELGFSERDLQIVQKNIQKSFGMILATGPTGSGKTTTLYSIIDLLNSRDNSLITIEDPIEYTVPGITQIQVNPRTNLTFALGLRAIVRQDPNIIMVGEIRDEETAGIAVNAAMTGHLLLSTLHTNDAAVTLPRLLDMEIEPFLIASTVNVAIGQRLVRRLCQDCASKRPMTDIERESFAEILPEEILNKYNEFYEPQGCVECNNTGFVGRIGIYEVLEIEEEIRRMIMKRENADEIRRVAVENGMRTMIMDGFEKAAKGVTSLAEVMRVVHE